MTPPRLDKTGWLAETALQKVLAALGAGEGATRIVGGAVRNALMGLPVTDVDLATTLAPEDVVARAKNAKLKTVPTGIEHGTVTVIASGKPFEVTTLRVDVETDGRHAKVAFTRDWAEDARRRDFTINALYADADGTVHDPLGGYEDIAARRVCFIGDAEARIKEDYLRILRFFRFHASFAEGPLDARELSACIRLRAGLTGLSAERVGHEMVRLLAAPDPFAAVEALADTGLFMSVFAGAPYLFPFANLLRVERALGIMPDAMRRLAVLCCAVEEDADRVAMRLRLPNAALDRLKTAAGHWHSVDPSRDGIVHKERLYRLGAEPYADAVLMAWARRGAGPDDKAWRTAAALPAQWDVPLLPWRGADLTARGIAPGAKIGRILRAAETDWIAKDFPQDETMQKRILDKAISDKA